MIVVLILLVLVLVLILISLTILVVILLILGLGSFLSVSTDNILLLYTLGMGGEIFTLYRSREAIPA